jgi:hypothetical protein
LNDQAPRGFSVSLLPQTQQWQVHNATTVSLSTQDFIKQDLAGVEKLLWSLFSYGQHRDPCVIQALDTSPEEFRTKFVELRATGQLPRYTFFETALIAKAAQFLSSAAMNTTKSREQARPSILLHQMNLPPLTRNFGLSHGSGSIKMLAPRPGPSEFKCTFGTPQVASSFVTSVFQDLTDLYLYFK